MTDVNSAEHLYRVQKTVWEMLNDRGYDVSPIFLEKTLDEFKEEYSDIPDRNSLTILAVRKVTQDKLFVFFLEDEKVNAQSLRHCQERMLQQEVRHSILVLKGTMTSFAKNYIAELQSKLLIEWFQENQLLINVTRHTLVPPHFPLSDEEKKALLDRYKVKENQLPRISPEDPIARYFGLKRGQVVKIVRPSETAGRYVTYRLVF
ncbi:putative DNA-directed RNA polymerases II and IV subunit 5A [Blattamonas nauphoetae]|uniref:DNA-directed RNA polymerases II and IV subunit 5A n=1 Tax=Blattamonas nauphoetae TaxID=2049346 RepID=A0ABQ9WX70_9EUKA|nr:putative DNA-directed RNA polymerases II and IV subunit 5A [Blattamonas nauphoetae]